MISWQQTTKRENVSTPTGFLILYWRKINATPTECAHTYIPILPMCGFCKKEKVKSGLVYGTDRGMYLLMFEQIH